MSSEDPPVDQDAPPDPELAAAEAELEKSNNSLAWELSKAAVDVAGIVDPTPISDCVGAAMSIADGDFLGAGLSLISVVPYIGDALGKTAKGARAAKKVAALRHAIAAQIARIAKLKSARKTISAGSRARSAANATKDIRRLKTGPKAPCPRKAAAKAAAAAGKGKLDLTLYPDWKQKLRGMSKKVRLAVARRRAELRKEVVPQVERNIRRLHPDWSSKKCREAAHKKTNEILDSFDWTKPDEIRLTKARKGQTFHKIQGEQPKDLSKVDAVYTSHGPAPKRMGDRARENAQNRSATPDQNPMTHSQEFKVGDGEGDVLVVEGPISGGRYKTQPQGGGKATWSDHREGGGNQAVLLSGFEGQAGGSPPLTGSRNVKLPK